MFERIDKSYDKDSLRTPQYLFNWLNECYQFDVDVAASDEHHLVDKYFTKENSALTADQWCHIRGFAFCNPPYSKGNIEAFLEKAIEQRNEHGITTVFVIPEFNGEARTRVILKEAARVIHFNQRVNFIHPITGKEVKGNSRGTMIAIIDNGYGIARHTYQDLSTIKKHWSKEV